MMLLCLGQLECPFRRLVVSSLGWDFLRNRKGKEFLKKERNAGIQGIPWIPEFLKNFLTAKKAGVEEIPEEQRNQRRSHLFTHFTCNCHCCWLKLASVSKSILSETLVIPKRAMSFTRDKWVVCVTKMKKADKLITQNWEELKNCSWGTFFKIPLVFWCSQSGEFLHFFPFAEIPVNS